MATDTELISDDFSDVACSLLKEYSSEIDKLRTESIQILDSYHLGEKKGDKDESKYLERRYRDNVEFFNSLLSAYQTLIRKTSQWIQHAKEARPGKQLELEVRLGEFERRLLNAQRFFRSKQL
jgi:hypothetical protein